MWLIKAVHMIPAPQGVDAEWSSYWASLTFQAGTFEPHVLKAEAH